MPRQVIGFQLNGEAVEVFYDPGQSLLHLLRNHFQLFGSKEGCGRGECGACTVLLDQLPVNACLIPAGKVSGRQVTTIEGLKDDHLTKEIQEAFVRNGAVQCGYCTPGMVISAQALLQKSPQPGAVEVKQAISGHICRCSGYRQIEEAIHDAADQVAAKGECLD